MRTTPLARAATTQDEGGGVAFLADARLSRPAALQVPSRAAEEALHEFVEEVACEEHVDPRVAAAVEAGQEHGNDEGRGCGAGPEGKENRCHSGAIPDLPTQPRLPQQQPSQVPLAGSQGKVPATQGMPLSHILAQGSLPDLTRAQHSPKSYLALALNSSFPRHRRPLSFTGAICIEATCSFILHPANA